MKLPNHVTKFPTQERKLPSMERKLTCFTTKNRRAYFVYVAAEKCIKELEKLVEQNKK